MARRAGVRGRDRGVQPAAGAGVHPTGDLLRLAGPRPGRRTGRRRRVHRPRPDPHPRPGGAVPARRPADGGEGRRGGRRRRGGRGRGPGRRRPDPAGLAPRAGAEQPRPVDAVPGRRSGRRRHDRPLARRAAHRLRRRRNAGAAHPGGAAGPGAFLPVLAAAGLGGGVLLPVTLLALKVGALSYGGGFVIIPLMRADAVDQHHWMTDAQFLNAVALGQITPGPVVQTIAVVGYAAAGIGGGLLAVGGRVRPVVRVHPAGRAPLRPDPRQPHRPGVPRRRRTGRDRRDPRLRRPAGPRAEPAVAVRDPGRRRRSPAGAAPRPGADPADRRRGRRRHRLAGGALPAVIRRRVGRTVDQSPAEGGSGVCW